MHKGCPGNCTDFVNTLSDGTILDIMKLLDPGVSKYNYICRTIYYTFLLFSLNKTFNFQNSLKNKYY